MDNKMSLSELLQREFARDFLSPEQASTPVDSLNFIPLFQDTSVLPKKISDYVFEMIDGKKTIVNSIIPPHDFCDQNDPYLVYAQRSG